MPKFKGSNTYIFYSIITTIGTTTIKRINTFATAASSIYCEYTCLLPIYITKLTKLNLINRRN